MVLLRALFIALINDASENSITHSFKYVDDLSFVEVSPAKHHSNIDIDVQDLDAWANKIHLKLNPSKCKAMQICFKMQFPSPLEICFKMQFPSPLDLHIAGTKLEVVNETRSYCTV